MIRVILLILVTASFFSCKLEEPYADDPQGDWQKIQSELNEFSVLFPRNAIIVKDTTDYLIEDSLTVRLYAYRQAFIDVKAYNVVYQVGVSERTDLKFKENVEWYFNAKKQQILDEMQAKFISEVDVKDMGHMGRRFVFETQLQGRQAQIIAYYIYNRNKIYSFEIYTYSRLQDPQNAAIDKFFGSIRLDL